MSARSSESLLKTIQMLLMKSSVRQIIHVWRNLIKWKVENEFEVALHFVFILTIPYVKWWCLLKIPSIIIWDIAKKIKIGCHKISDLGKNEVVGLHSTFLNVDTWPSIATVFEASKIKQNSSTFNDTQNMSDFKYTDFIWISLRVQ